MIALWLGVLVLFWIAYFRVTRGALTRHLGFLHFGIYFFAIYLGAYQIYVDNGSVDNTFMYSVVLYPLLALLGMVLAKSVGSRTTFDVTGLAIDRRETMLVCGMVAFLLGAFQCLWYKVTERIIAELSPFFTMLAIRSGFRPQVIQDVVVQASHGSIVTRAPAAVQRTGRRACHSTKSPAGTNTMPTLRHR